MKAVEFIKEYGWEEAKRRTEPNMIDMWDAGWGFYTSELKKYIDAYELVQSYGGIDEAEYHVYVETIDDCYFNVALSKSITLVEEIEA